MLNYLWGGERPADAKPENEDPELAIREAMQLHGEFKKTKEGTLQWKDFLVFRAIATRQGIRSFAAYRTELKQRSLAAFREQNWDLYKEIHREGQREYQRCVVLSTQRAAEWIDLDQEHFLLTVRKFMEDAKKKKELEEKDYQVRLAAEKIELTKTEEDYIKATKFRYVQELETMRALSKAAITMGKEAQDEF